MTALMSGGDVSAQRGLTGLPNSNKGLNMMRLRSFIPPLGMMLLAAGEAGAQAALIEKSEIRFGCRKMRFNLEGRFRKWKANVVFLPKDLAHSRAELEIDLGSIDVSNDEFESELKRPAWFDTDQFPVAHFVSHTMRHVGADRYDISGRLTVKGITREVLVPITLRKDAAGNSVAEGNFILSRSSFGIGEGAPEAEGIANDVTIRIRMALPPVR